MRRILLGVLILCLLALTIYVMVEKLEIGSFEVLGIKKILNKNDELDETIKQAKTVVEVEVENKKKELNNAYNQMNIKKTDYEELISVSTEEEVQFASQFLTYNVEFLWTRIGNHAKSEGVKLKIDFKENTTVANNYDLDFTVTGEYIGITDFLYKIENDSELGFKIENFALTSGAVNVNTNSTTKNGETSNATQSTLIGTFTCKNITVNGIEKITTTGQNITEGVVPTNQAVPNADNTNGATNTNSSTTNTTNAQ